MDGWIIKWMQWLVVSVVVLVFACSTLGGSYKTCQMQCCFEPWCILAGFWLVIIPMRAPWHSSESEVIDGGELNSWRNEAANFQMDYFSKEKKKQNKGSRTLLFGDSKFLHVAIAHFSFEEEKYCVSKIFLSSLLRIKNKAGTGLQV